MLFGVIERERKVFFVVVVEVVVLRCGGGW
jgi:hypothetical protein